MEPLFSFAILLAVIWSVPPLFERLRLPGLVGLLAAGVLLGPHALNLLDAKSETMKLLSDIGVVYLLFVAGLEIDVQLFRKVKHRAMGFGSLTFSIPLILGSIIGLFFGFGWNAALLLGSLFASHTPLGYPIVRRLGVVGNEAVIVTIGGTMFTDIAALVVLAICISIHKGEFTLSSLVLLLGSLVLYSLAILFGLDWAGREFFRRSGDEEGNQFLFVLLALFVAAAGAELIGVEKIVGAFLAGIAVNDVVGRGPVKEKVEFVGSVLFIPIFFVNMGLLIDLPAFVKTLSSIWLTVAIVLGLIVSKFAASWLTKLIYRYNRNEMLTMFSLSVPQVAATLAATLVGTRAGVFDHPQLGNDAVLNSVIVLMLVTATLGPIITSQAAIGLPLPATPIHPETIQLDIIESKEKEAPFTVVVPIYNPQTQEYLIQMAALLASHEQGRILPLVIASARLHMDDPQLEAEFERSHQLLARATAVSQKFPIKAEPAIRISSDVATGICRSSREQNASLIVMGWGPMTGIRARLFGNVTDDVLWASHCPVAITRLLESPTKIQRILLPIGNITEKAVRKVRFAEILADTNQASVTLLHVYNPRIRAEQIDQIASQLSVLVSDWQASTQVTIQMKESEDAVKTILEAAESHDLVVLRSLRRRIGAEGLAISDITTELVERLNCSVVMLGEPQNG